MIRRILSALTGSMSATKVNSPEGTDKEYSINCYRAQRKGSEGPRSWQGRDLDRTPSPSAGPDSPDVQFCRSF